MNPRVLQARHERLRRSLAPLSVPDRWSSDLAAVLRTIDLQPRVSAEMASESDHSSVYFGCLLRGDASPADVVSAWREALSERRYVSAAEGLLFEFHFNMKPYEIAQALPSAYSFLKTLHVIRTRTGIALHDYARAVNWRRPILFVEILKLAREYHRAAVSAESLTRQEHKKEFTGRLGVAGVLISRFARIELDEANEAVSALQDSLAQGNPVEDATPYLLEAMAVQYDLTGDIAILREGLNVAGDATGPASRNVKWALAGIELALRLHDELESAEDRLHLRVYSENLLRMSRLAAVDAEDHIRLIVIDRILAVLQDSGRLGLRGFRNPFGFRSPARGGAIETVIPSLLPELRPMAETGEPLARGIYADLLEHLTIPPSRLLAKLRLAVAMRGSGEGWDALADERSRLLTYRDRLQISAISRDASSREQSMRDLVSLSSSATCGVAALVIISEDIERNGACEIRADKSWTKVDVGTARSIEDGDFRKILSEAAKDAISNPDLSVSSLGGRSGVITVSDYFDVVGGTFVFKKTTAQSWLREFARSEALRDALSASGLDVRFGVVEHLSPFPEELADTESQQYVNSVRRFASGVVLSEYAKDLSRDDQVSALAYGANCLGHMNRLERSLEAEPSTGVRKEVKSKEVGRWLRRIVGSDVGEYFNRFWSLYEGLPNFKRRDAHPLNWLVVTPKRLLAVDLEATGWRPLTYEVAQLTEDSCLLSPGDWEARRAVLAAYLEGCGECGGDAVWSAFEASVFARSLRKLTPPTGAGHVLQHGHDVLEQLSNSASDPAVRWLAKEILVQWSASRGLADLTHASVVTLTDARRQRLSRSMSYHLRHGSELTRTSDGWADIGELSSLVKQGATVRELILVASDFREPRFELNGSRVRSLYGHTVKAVIERERVLMDASLFHAVPLGVADVVLTNEGLRPMERTHVHLSSIAGEALVAGRRKGQSVLLTVETDRLPEIRHAAEGTYVVPQVPPQSLRVVPTWFLSQLDGKRVV